MSSSRDPSKLLLIEDNPAYAENLHELLLQRGLHCLAVASAERALEVVQTQRVSGILTDYNLPERNGVEFLRELRSIGVDVPVVLMSAFVDLSLIMAAQAAGALEVLSKPVDIDSVVALFRDAERTRHDDS